MEFKTVENSTETVLLSGFVNLNIDESEIGPGSIDIELSDENNNTRIYALEYEIFGLPKQIKEFSEMVKKLQSDH